MYLIEKKYVSSTYRSQFPMTRINGNSCNCWLGKYNFSRLNQGKWIMDRDGWETIGKNSNHFGYIEFMKLKKFNKWRKVNIKKHPVDILYSFLTAQNLKLIAEK